MIRTHASKVFRIPPSFLRGVPGVVRKVWKSEKVKTLGDVSVVFTGRKKIRQLNQKFLSTKGDTDVIAFPYENEGGDIFICVPVARENAKRFNEPFLRELKRLVVHGALHLLGYADSPKQERIKMWKKQEALVEGL